MTMRLDLLIASVSAGLLVYSGRLLAPAARLRLEDIIVYKALPPGTTLYSPRTGRRYSLEGAEMWPAFPEDNIRIAIHDGADNEVGFYLLVFGTIGSVLTIIVGNFAFSLNIPPALDIASAPAALALGIGAGWWMRRRWYGKRERSLLVCCFLLWLEHEVGNPEAQARDFGGTVVSIARHSRFTLMGVLAAPLEADISDADERAIAHRVVALARECRYRWRRDDIRTWANEVARGAPNATAEAGR